VAHVSRVTLMVHASDLRLVEYVMKVMAGQPDGATREEIRRHLNQDGSAPRGAPPPRPPRPPPPPGGAPRPGGVHSPAGVAPPGRALPPRSPGGAPPQRSLPPGRQGASSYHSPPANHGSDSNSDDSDNPRPPVRRHLHGGRGSTCRTGGSGTRGVLGELFDKEISLREWVLVWEMEAVVRKVMQEVPRETMIPGMWVLGGVVAVVVGW